MLAEGRAEEPYRACSRAGPAEGRQVASTRTTPRTARPPAPAFAPGDEHHKKFYGRIRHLPGPIVALAGRSFVRGCSSFEDHARLCPERNEELEILKRALEPEGG
jgi:hypothetical protein